MMPREGGMWEGHTSDFDGAYRRQRLLTFAGPCSLGLGADHAGDKLPDCGLILGLGPAMGRDHVRNRGGMATIDNLGLLESSHRLRRARQHQVRTVAVDLHGDAEMSDQAADLARYLVMSRFDFLLAALCRSSAQSSR
jgi:hypothetical protein